MKYIGTYIWTLLKNLIIAFIFSGVLIYIFPGMITLIIGLLFILGAFANASGAVKERKTQESREALNRQNKFSSPKNENTALIEEELIVETNNETSIKKPKSIFDEVELD